MLNVLASATRSSAAVAAARNVTGMRWLSKATTEVVEGTAEGSALAYAAPKGAKLANGVQVAAIDGPGALADVVISVGAGSRDQATDNVGAAHVFKASLFKSTETRSAYRVVQDLEDLGAEVTTALERERVVVQARVLREKVPALLAAVGDSLANPRFKSWEVADSIATVRAEAKAAAGDKTTQLVESFHRVAYGGRGLGLPLNATAAALDALNPDAVRAFHAANVTGANITVSGVNVSLDELQSASQAALGEIAQGSAVSRSDSEYIGGGSYDQIPGEVTYAAVGGAASAVGTKEAYAYEVLAEILTNKSDGAQVVNVPYSDSGIFVAVSNTNDAVPSDLEAAGKVDAATLKAAKKAVLTRVVGGVTGDRLASALATAAAAGDLSLADTAAAKKGIEGVTAAQVQKAAKALNEQGTGYVQVGAASA